MDNEILQGEIDALRHRLKPIEDTLDTLVTKIEYVTAKINDFEKKYC